MIPSNRPTKGNVCKTKCGDIFTCSKDLVSLICDICGDVCYTMVAFGAHILTNDHIHLQPTRIKQEDSDNSVLDIKSEDNAKNAYDNLRTTRPSNVFHHEQNGIEKPQNLTENKTKCGEIFQITEDIFTLICDRCTENFYTLEAFGVHILHDHSTMGNDIVFTFDTVAGQILSSQSERVEIERPPFVSINLKEEHEINDIRDTEISEPNKSNDNDVDAIKATKHKKSFNCNFCDKIFSQTRDRDDHENTHMGKYPYECFVCQKTYSAFSSIKTHLKLHSADLPHKCLVCEKSFFKRIKLDHHTREKHLPATDPQRFFPCNYCEILFKTYSNMRRHVHTHHKPIKTGTFICDYCQKIFLARSKIVRHIQNHVVKDTKHKCRFCDKMLPSKYYHRKHVSEHHAQRPNEMPQCQLCMKSFKFTGGLRRHIKNIHSDKRKIKREKLTRKTKRPHQCKICKKILTTSSSLRQHILTHTKERPHKCSLCAASFIQPNALTIHHRENHLPDTDPRRYFQCTLCETQFLTYSKLRYHSLKVACAKKDVINEPI